MILGTVTTDWITAIAALSGIPVAVWGIFKLFIKDKDQAQKIKYFGEQIDELRKQTSQFEIQTQLISESNQLLEKQIQLQREIFLEEKTKEDARAEIDKQKRKTDIKPRFVFNGSFGSGTDFTLKLLNKGGNAENIKVQSVNTDQVVIRPIKEGLIVENGQILTIGGIANPNKTYFNANQVSCQILLSFTNSDKDKYLQKIIKAYNGFQVENPYEDNE